MKKTIWLLTLLTLIGLSKQSAAQPGINLFDDAFLHRIEFTQVDESQISIPLYKGIYQSVEMKIDGKLLSKTGLTTKGEKSYLAAQYDKKPFKIKTDKYISSQKYDGIKRFNLHNNTYDKGIMREKLSCDASRALGIPAPKVAFAEVYINGKYWGIYTLVEAQDEIYKRTFGNNDGYTMESFGSAANLNNLAYYGNTPEDYEGQYIVDHGNDSTAWSLWIRALYQINNLPPRVAYVDSVSKYIDYLSFFRFNAVLDYNLNAEPKNKNGIYYFDVADRKWHTICWDQNVSFPTFGDPGQRVFPNTQMTAFLDKYATYSQFTEAYNEALCKLANSIFTASELKSKISSYRKLIDQAVENDSRKGFSYKEYELSLKDLEEFISRRNTETGLFLSSQQYNCLTTGIPSSPENGIRVYPNPATNRIFIHDPANRITEFSISNLQGSVLLKNQLNTPQIDLTYLPSGIYILELFDINKRVSTRKIIKN